MYADAEFMWWHSNEAIQQVPLFTSIMNARLFLGHFLYMLFAYNFCIIFFNVHSIVQADIKIDFTIEKYEKNWKILEKRVQPAESDNG